MRSVLRAGFVVASVVVVAWVGCGRNDDLGYDGSGGGGGKKTVGSTSVHASSSSSVAVSSSSGTGGAEPNLPTAFTVVNGVNDYPAARFCFLPGETPWPSSPAGLPFGTGQPVDITTLPAGVDLTTWVIAGDLASTAGMTCSQMIALAASFVPDAGSGAGGAPTTDAGNPDASAGAGGSGAGGGPTDAGADGGADASSDAEGSDGGEPDGGGPDGGEPDGGGVDAGPANVVVAKALATIPASAFMSDRSALFVATGCLGGPGHDNMGAPNGCGMGYTSATPTAAAILVAMSRITNENEVSLQIVSASPALVATDFRVQPANAQEVSVAPNLTPGAIGPTPPFDALPISGYGPIGTVTIHTYAPSTTSATSATLLSTILASGSVTAADFVNGANLVFVAVGASPGTPAGPFWHPLSYALVKANPG